MFSTMLWSGTRIQRARCCQYSTTILPSPSWSVKEKYLDPHKVEKPITSEQLQKLFRLCYLSPKENDFSRFFSDIDKIVQCVTEIHSLNTDNVKPLFSVLDDIMEKKVITKENEMPLKTRPDIVDPRFTKTTEILKNAAVKHGQFFAVPKVKENDVTN